MKLNTLNARFGANVSGWTPETGGTPNGVFQIIFRCPVCPKPHEISFHVAEKQSDSPRLWAVTPYPPNGSGWLDEITVTPSIDNTHNLVKRGNPEHCLFHGSIINGEVIP